MKSFQQYFLLVLLFSLLISACREECEDVYHDVPIQPYLQKFQFEQGSYWVYEDSASGQLDSIYITGSELTSVTQSYGNPPNYDDCYDKAVYETFHYQYLDFASSLNGPLFSEELGAAYMEIGPSRSETNTIVYFEHSLGDTLYNGAYFQAHYDSLTVNGQSFTDVRKFVLPPIVPTYNLGTTLRYNFFLNEEGLIRFELRDEMEVVESVWNVVRWSYVRS